MLKRRHPGLDSVTTTEYTCVQSLRRFGFYHDILHKYKGKVHTCTDTVQAVRPIRGLGFGVTPTLFFATRKDPVPIVQKAGWNDLGRFGNSRPPPGFDTRTVQPIFSHYTDYATRHLSLYSNTQIQAGISKTSFYEQNIKYSFSFQFYFIFKS